MQTKMDLTALVPDFPENPPLEIPRDVVINNVIRQYSPRHQKKLIHADFQCGKSNFLAQYCRTLSGRAISYFITDNPITHSKRNFLFTLTQQISFLLGKNPPTADLTISQLEPLAFSLAGELSAVSTQTGEKYFFVIDGIDKVIDSPTGSIASDFNLQSYNNSPYLLYSCRTSNLDYLPDVFKTYERENIEYGLLFNRTDTEKVLELKLKPEIVDLIQEKSRGVPGYIAIIKNSIDIIGVKEFSEIDLSEDLTNLTNDFIEKLFSKLDENTKLALFYASACARPINIDTIKELVNKKGIFSQEKMTKTELVQVEKATVKFKNDLVRDAVKTMIGEKKNSLCKDLLLIENAKEKKDEQLITTLLAEVGEYASVAETLQHKSLVNVIETTGDLAGVIRRARLATDLAIRKGEIDDSISWSWLVQVLDVFYLHTIMSSEIQALISIGDSQTALRKIYSLPESISKIRLLGRTYAQMKERQEHIPIAAIEELSYLIDNHDFDYSDKELIRDLAIDLFEILPDKSIAFMEKVMGVSERQNIIDATLAVNIFSDDEKDERKGEEVIDPKLGFVARIASSWLAKKSLANLISETDKLDNKIAKEFMIRQWCLQNRESEELPFGIELWLDLITAETSIGISLKNLRQLSGLLDFIRNEKDKLNTIKRLEIPSFSSLSTPWEEWIGFHLNIAETLFSLKQSESLARIENIYERINVEVIDLDIKVFCYARLYRTAKKLGLNSENDIRNNLERVLSELLGNSALQDKILEKTIKTISQVDPDYALDIALRLNSSTRKSGAIATVIKSAFTDNLNFDMEKLWNEALLVLESSEASLVLLKICERIKRRKLKLSSRNQTLLRKAIDQIQNPLQRSGALINLATVWSNPEIRPVKLVELGIQIWEQISDLKERIEHGFHFVEILSETNHDSARELCKKTQSLLSLPGGVLVSGALGIAYLNTIELIIRSLDSQILNKEDYTNKIYELTERIPSQAARIYLYTQLAAKSYALGNYLIGNDIVSSKIHKTIDNCQSDFELKELVEIVFPVLSIYDFSLAIGYTGRFDNLQKNTILARAILWNLTKRFINDSINIETLKAGASYNDFRDRLLPLMKLLDIDHHIYAMITVLTNTITNSVRENKLEKTQAFDLLLQLENTCSEKLPDPKNIQHAGYLLICQSRINRSRATINKLNKRGGGQSKIVIGEKWKELRSNAEGIANMADKVFILAILASDLFVWDPAGAEKILARAEELSNKIPAIIDRGHRLEVIADVWGDWRDDGKAKYLYLRSLELAEQLDPFSRDQKIELATQFMYRLNPEFADEIIQKYDKRVPSGASTSTHLRLEESKLIKDPQELLSAPAESLIRHPRVIRNSAKSLLKKLVSEGGVVYNTNVLIEWVKETMDQDVNTTRDVLTWVIENINRQKAKTSGTKLFGNLLTVGEVISYLINWISPTKLEGIPLELTELYPGMSSKLIVFYPGEITKAKSWVKKWIDANADEYIKISDPYFGPSDLEFVQRLSGTTKIFIVTTDKKFEENKTEIELKRELASAWQQLSPNTPMPSMVVVVVPTKFDVSFHDRFIITRDKGLELGTSLNGLGNKLHKITELNKEDSQYIENKYIDPMLGLLLWSTKHNITPMYLSF